MGAQEFSEIVDINICGGVKFRTVSGGKLSSTKKTFAGAISVKVEDIKGMCVCKIR